MIHSWLAGPSSSRWREPFAGAHSRRDDAPGLVRRCNAIALLAILAVGSGTLLRSAEAQQAGGAPAPGKPRLAAEFRHDFRDSKLDTQTMARVGTNSDQFVRPDREGLRIHIPGGLNNPEAVGVAPRCRVKGDFEITVSFKIVNADQPIRGYGVGASLWVETKTATNEALTIERGIIPKEGERFTSTRVSGYSLDRKYNVRRARGRSRSGKLRMERVGTKATTSFADGDEPFRVLRTVELGPEDLTLVRLAAETGVSDHSVLVLFEDLTIRAEALPGLKRPPAKPETTPKPAPPAQ